MTTLTQISETQAQKATTANENFDAVAPAGLFGRKALTTVALTWGYYGGIMYIDGVATSIADGTLSLTANQTNYIEATRAGVVSANITGFTSGRIPLYTAVAGAATISSYADQREISETFRRSFAYVNMSGSPSTVTLSATQARCDSLELQYASSGAVLIVPSVAGRWFIYNNSGQTVTVQTTAGGSPTPATVTLVHGSTSLVFCDGTNVRTANIYDSAAVAITGGTINGTAIGGTTPAAGAFTTLSATGAVTLGDNAADVLTITSDKVVSSLAGGLNLPLQSGFLAYNSVTDADKTGNSAQYTVIFDTEIFDQNADYDNSTGVFTAPVTGKYRFCCAALIVGITGTPTVYLIRLVTSNRTIYKEVLIGTFATVTEVSMEFSQLLDMDAGDTASVVVQLNGMAGDTADVYGEASTTHYTMFSGELAF